MDLKFTFGGASPDHGHEAHDRGDAPSGIPLPFSTAPGLSTSSVLEVRVRRAESGDALLAEAVSGDGVVYCDAEAPVRGGDADGMARAVRSAVSRAVAALEGPLAESVSEVVLELGGAGSTALRELGLAVDETRDPAASVDDALQRRIGVAAGTPIRVAP